MTCVLGVKRLLCILNIDRRPRLMWVAKVNALERKSRDSLVRSRSKIEIEG